jgi:ribosomal protein S24E
MEMNIEKEKENKFFNRRDLTVKIKHKGAATPSKADLTKELAKKYKVDESQVMIDYIFTMHGLNESTAKVKILNEKPKVEEKKEESEKVEAQTSKNE